MAPPRGTLMGWTVATSLRFRYLVAALGALVMAVGIVVLGGLFTSTLLSLFVIPALYLRFGRARERAAAA